MTAMRVLVTGTTSGLGRALVEHFAKSGAAVTAVNRRRVPELEAELPTVRFEHVDVRSKEEVSSLLRRLAETGNLPDVFILNAGINRVDNDEAFRQEIYEEVVQTNLYGVLNFVGPLTALPPLAPGTGPRHVVAVSSMASYVGNPYGLGYHTSKRALSACFDVWSHMYAGTDLVFQQVMLGPVSTSIYTMSDRFPSWMVRLRDLFSAPLGGTAEAVAAFSTTRKRTLYYPRRAVPLYVGMGLARAIVPGFFRGKQTLAGQTRRTAEPSRDPASRGTGFEEGIR